MFDCEDVATFSQCTGIQQVQMPSAAGHRATEHQQRSELHAPRNETESTRVVCCVAPPTPRRAQPSQAVTGEHVAADTESHTEIAMLPEEPAGGGGGGGDPLDAPRASARSRTTVLGLRRSPEPSSPWSTSAGSLRTSDAFCNFTSCRSWTLLVEPEAARESAAGIGGKGLLGKEARREVV